MRLLHRHVPLRRLHLRHPVHPLLRRHHRLIRRLVESQ